MFGDGSSHAILVIDGSDAIYSAWTHLAITYDGTDYRAYLNGVLDVAASVPFVPNNVAPLRIGYDQPGDGWDDHWSGDIDEVAFYQKALTEEQVAAHYAAALYGKQSRPIFTKQPESSSAIVGSDFFFAPTVEGSTPIRLQWTKNGLPLPDETNYFLILTNVSYGDSGVYRLAATNGVGSTISEQAILSVLPTPTFARVTNGLVLHLSFDGNFLDSSGRTNHAQASGSPVFVAGAVGQQAIHVNTAVDFSDPNAPAITEANYVILGAPPDLQFSSNVNFSVSYWVRFTDAMGDLPFLCNAVNSYGNPGYVFAPSYGFGGWSWSLGDFNTPNVLGIYGEDDSINDSRWHHLVHTFDRASSGITYLDGLPVDSRSIVPAGDIDTDEETTIGQDPTGEYPEPGEFDIDDVGVWRRVLTPFEVAAIHAAGLQGKSFDSSGPVSLAVTRNADGIQLLWQAGTLVEASDALGPWSPVAGAAPPYYAVKPNAGRKFYRILL